MPTFLPALVILSAAALAILFILYRIYETRVDEPRKLEDEIKEALEGARPDVESIEPVRKAAIAIAYNADKIVIVRDFGKKPRRVYGIKDLIGIEVFIDNRLVARVLRAGPHKMLDDIAPQVNKVTIRLIFDDPANPDYELVLWDPHDALTARAEGPRAAMETARKWFYHVEAILRRPASKDIKTPPPTVPAPEPAKAAASAKLPAPDAEAAPAPAPKPQGDVLNAPLIPYL